MAEENKEVLSEEELDEVTGGVHVGGMTGNEVGSVRAKGEPQLGLGFGAGQTGAGEAGAGTWQGEGIGLGIGKGAGIAGASTGLGLRSDGKGTL